MTTPEQNQVQPSDKELNCRKDKSEFKKPNRFIRIKKAEWKYPNLNCRIEISNCPYP